MRILVTGATGLVGSAIARELVARGHAVRALARAKSDLSNLGQLDVEITRGDILDPASLPAAMAGCEVVVHTAGLVGFRPGMREKLLRVNEEGVRNVFEAARAAGVRRALLTSSTSAQGGTFGPRVGDEQTPSNAEWLGIDYFVSKWRGELAARAVGAKGLEVVILRPGYVLGPGDLGRSSGATVLLFVTRRLRGFVEGGVSFCDVRDVARAHAEAVEHGRPGEVYLLGGHNLRMSEAVRRVSAICGMAEPRMIPYPVALAGAMAGELWQRLGGRRWLPVQFVRSISTYTFVSSDKAARELGYAVRPFEDMARDTLRWWLARGKLEPTTPELRALSAEVAPKPDQAAPAAEAPAAPKRERARRAHPHARNGVPVQAP